ncbi:hypothetical protein G6F17_011908 [Rhizopus arrhizus]|nr:hypothetical protein G6F19_012048 [Rhizopus arrhizus]KAG0848142.1 hypothetical protein G6F17_011908 [Rhizopus arrhizus]KAG0868952.1 hypothetical protein G6F15_012040 [Rhizopus arrhizus]KAG1106446.1 hypothetical protein G6F42_016749 [Rhizopus arrhizus]KAG1169023.1 hypothetical protein G6F36_012141 [Rhizopus arrhizus]
MARSSLPMSYDCLWSSLQSLCIHQSLQTHITLLSVSKLQNFGVLGRLDSGSKLKAISYPASSSSVGSFATTRLDSELQEISPDSYTAVRTPGLSIEYSYDDGISTSQEASGYPSINQTNTGQAFPTNSKDSSQFDYANPSGNLCYLPSTPLHETSSVFQEPGGEIGRRLGPSSTFRPSQQGGATLVVRQFEEIERSLSSPFNSHSNDLCGCKQHGMGVQFGQTTCTWLLDSRGSGSVNQLAGTEGGSISTTDFPKITELDNSNQDRQHNQPVVYQQTRWNTVAPFNESSNGSLELMSSAQHYDSSSTYQRDLQQNSRYGVSPNILQEPMANNPNSIPTDSTTMGPVLDRPLCRQDNQVVTKLRVLASGSGRYPHGCLHSTMDELDEAFRKSPWNLISQVLNKIMQEKHPLVVMVVPYWPSALWLPLLQRMALSPL